MLNLSYLNGAIYADFVTVPPRILFEARMPTATQGWLLALVYLLPLTANSR